MFFLLYRQNDIDKIIEGNYQNYIINKLTCDIIIFYFFIFFVFSNTTLLNIHMYS